jgi:tRNA U34 2-thiouridine synthase MnmA/TrmU
MEITTKKKPNIIRALGICSGGLDSILSAMVLKEQEIDVTWVHFETPFFSSEKARQASFTTGIPLIVKDITATYLEMLKDPHCGYGGNMNPCLDCHTLMFRMAGKIMKAEGYHFLFSGEVLGQRPMSQTRPSLRYVEKNSGAEGYILRPLSAKLLAPTIPEETGLVDRERLLDISGRGRKRQMALAAKYDITDYPAPAGGCLLTDKGFSRRLKDLFDHQSHYEKREFELLKYGRHFRIEDHHKVVVGRTKSDNSQIAALVNTKTDITIRMKDIPSPMVLIPYGATDKVVQEAGELCTTYSKAKNGKPARIAVRTPEGSQIMTVTAPARDKFQAAMI